MKIVSTQSNVNGKIRAEINVEGMTYDEANAAAALQPLEMGGGFVGQVGTDDATDTVVTATNTEGTPAAATVVVQNGVITNCVITEYGTGFTEMPVLTLAGDGTGAVLEPVAGASAINVIAPGTDYHEGEILTHEATGLSVLIGPVAPGGIPTEVTVYDGGAFTEFPTGPVTDFVGPPDGTGFSLSVDETTPFGDVTIETPGTGYVVGELLTHAASGTVFSVETTGGGGAITGVAIQTAGAFTTTPGLLTGLTGSAAGTDAVFTLQTLTGSELSIANGGSGYNVGDVLTHEASGTEITVDTIGAGGAVATFTQSTPGTFTLVGYPIEPITEWTSSPAGSGLIIAVTEVSLVSINVINGGSGYVDNPTTVSFTVPSRAASIPAGLPLTAYFDPATQDAENCAMFWTTTMINRLKAKLSLARDIVIQRQNQV